MIKFDNYSSQTTGRTQLFIIKIDLEAFTCKIQIDMN
jgi:hypothetical protein